MHATLLYLLYGNGRRYQDELSYSVMSALRHAGGGDPGFRILLACDAQSRRDDLPVENWILSPQQMHDWTFGGSYPHALKLFVIAQALRRQGGLVCLADTDTDFHASPQGIFAMISDQTSVMQADEGPIGASPAWQPLIAAGAAADPSDLLSEVLAGDMRMLNSGIVGVGQVHLQPVLAAADLARRLHAIEPVFNIEQFALGAMLQRHGEVRVTGSMVTHYWGYRKHIYHRRIPGALARIGHDYSPAAAARLPQVTAPKKPLMARIAARLAPGLRQVDSAYRFAWLCRACCLRARDPVDRGIWAATALHMLRQSRTTGHARRDFRAFLPENMPKLQLDAENRTAWECFWQHHAAAGTGSFETDRN